MTPFFQNEGLALLNSITDATANDAGKIGISGSHGGIFAAAVASRAALRAVALNDAGRGLDDAGVAGVAALDQVGMAGLTVDVGTALIGDAEDTLMSGRVSFANETALALGVEVGVDLAAQIDIFSKAIPPKGQLDPVSEGRWDQAVMNIDVLCVDSASLIQPGDAGRIIVTGSHGGLIGGDPARACKADAAAVFFNDAGRGKADCGLTRLPALDQRGISAATLDCQTCRIGDARSSLETGVISAVNKTAGAQGLRIGMTVRAAIKNLV